MSKNNMKSPSKPIQKRARLTRERVLDGLECLLAGAEFEEISIADLADEAGVSVGSVYSHFKDKDALLPALLDRQLERTQDRLAELRERGTINGIAVTGPGMPDLRASITLSIRETLKHINQSIGVRRALLTFRRLNPDRESPLATTLREQAHEALAFQFQLYREEIARENLNEAATLVSYFINILFLDRILYVKSATQHANRPDDETLIEAYTDMVYHYLTKP